MIAAAGSGERLGAGGPKAFVSLGGRPMISWSLDACLACGSVATVVVAVPAGHRHGLDGTEGLVTVDGGRTRAESVANALAQVETELVAIHDAARPLLTAALLDDLVAELVANPDADAIIAAAPVTDTVKKVRRTFRVSGNQNLRQVSQTVDRSELWAAQTPQVFRTNALRAALDVDQTVRDAATDEAMLIEAVGGKVLVHDPGVANLKVTDPVDLRVAELLLRGR
ncbi:MAG TPA: 2-C-methyl-D-erythritol 4-phosphate cytidylyltransferase [Solirubrobacterales bacterium]|nr:2-C-methyl-D-erythritol 4-phosphate cytidylyltransferase [Solirubrobacterales bacterium]